MFPLQQCQCGFHESDNLLHHRKLPTKCLPPYIPAFIPSQFSAVSPEWGSLRRQLGQPFICTSCPAGEGSAHTKCCSHFRVVFPLLLQIKGDYPISGKLHCLSHCNQFWEVSICGKTECLWVCKVNCCLNQMPTPLFVLC